MTTKSQYMKMWRKRKKVLGICITCGKEPVNGKSNCEKCLKKMKNLHFKQSQKMEKNLTDPAYMAKINEKIRIGLANGL